MESLIPKKCVPCEKGAPALTGKELSALKSRIPDWDIMDEEGAKKLRRVFKFKNFKQALAFTKQVGELAEAQFHHPGIHLEWGRVEVIWFTHTIHGLHLNDVTMAVQTDTLLNLIPRRFKPVTEKAFQDYYPEELSHCYGCGRLNDHGLQLKSYWDGEESVALFQPEDKHMAVPGFVYGGLIASLIDCHCTGTAAAAAYRDQGRAMDSLPAIRFVTASLQVDYLAPTPIKAQLEVRGNITEVTPKKVIIEAKVMADGKVCAKGRVVAVHLPESMLKTMKGKK